MMGSCLCGAINWNQEEHTKEIFFCHCSQCRRHGGTIGAFATDPVESKIVKNLSNIRWFPSSDHGERGFCTVCGSKLFWRERNAHKLYAYIGALHHPYGYRAKYHIHVASKGDYYNITDDLPCYAGGSVQDPPLDRKDIPKKGIPSSAAAQRGGCLCGKIHYHLKGTMRPIVYCHCGQCFHSHGFYPGYTAARKDQIVLTGEEYLAWYRSSAKARRGFCKECGSALFWQRDEGDFTSVAAGTLDHPSGLVEGWHIFGKDRPDCYSLSDGLKVFPGTTPKNADF